MGIRYQLVDLIHKFRRQMLELVFSKQSLPPEIYLLLLFFKSLNLVHPLILIFIGLFDLNQKWKLYFFFFTVSFCLNKQQSFLLDYLSITFAGLICNQIYRNLIFPTIKDNILYFCGIATYFIVLLLKCIVLTDINSPMDGKEVIFVLPAALLVSFVVIRMRINQIKSIDVRNLRTPTIINQYIAMLQQQLEDEKNIHSYIFMHIKTCCQPSCFCQEIKHENILNLSIGKQAQLKDKIINSVFHELIYSQNWNIDDRIQIIQSYIAFLISVNKLIRAIQILYEMNENNMSFFNLCLNYRIKEKLKTKMRQVKYFDQNRLKLELICKYDSQIGFLTKEIREILFQKIKVWKQICIENPSVKILQKEGRVLVDRIQSLHKYFMLVVRPSEEILSVFKATILYSTYLVLTTNQTEFANSLIKKTKKFFQESKGETVNAGKEEGIFLKVVLNQEKMIQSIFQLIITNISTDFCRILNKDKSQILFKPLTILIPEQFITIHSRKLDSVIQSSNIQIKDSKFIDHSQQLPFLVGYKEIIFLNTISRLQVDPVSGSILIKCLVQRLNSQTKFVVMDFEENVYYTEQDHHKQSMNHPTVKSTLKRLKQDWELLGSIQKVQQMAIDNEQNVTFIFQPLFCRQLKQIGLPPLLRIGKKKEFLKKQIIRAQMFTIQNKVKNIEGIVECKQNDSQSSNSSRKDSIENVLALLMESSSLKTQVFLTITLLTIMVCSIVSFQIFNNFFTVWNTGIKQKNPVFTEINLIKVKILLNKALSWSYDIKKYEALTPESKQLFRSLYEGDSIVSIERGYLSNIFEEQQLVINQNILSQNNEVSLAMEDQMKKTLPIKNPLQKVISLDMSLFSILSNLLVQVFLLAEGKQLENTILNFGYLSQFYPEYSEVQNRLQKMLEEELVTTSRNIIIIVCTVSALYFLFLIPIWKFDVSNKKKHEKIYSLLASLQSKLIVQEIKKLEKVEGQMAAIVLQKQPSQKSIQAEDLPSSQQLQTNLQKGTGYENMYMLYEGISKLAVEEIYNNSKDILKIKVRKRVGEIVVEGSNCDKKKIRNEEWLLLSFLLLFLGMIHLIVWHKVIFMKFIDSNFKETFKQIKNYENYGLGILNSKVYSDNYNLTNRISFQNQDLRQWLQKWIQQSEKQSYQIENSEFQIQKCYSNMLMCKKSFSEVVLQSIIKKEIINSFDVTNKILNNEIVQNVLVEKTRFQLYFAQQLSDYIVDKKIRNLIENFTQIEKKDKKFQLQQSLIQIIFFLLVATFILFSILYTMRVKRNYVKQVTLLSILNKEMLFNNKRVESFLHQLSKKT